ncbi:endonuclease/exonuclease/phosphatase family protein [Nitratidesulfovibrio liaohensis]|uniref:Endonuclease/exonuclease/phosphatase family protein n=1 Tax=Nitratidesulfovibrio liaohensis TaxID=2604158 RepID=A0ABY9R4L5_9BACT|nr:endonuclease/exonuclease/phosphatase family protein [Nitratidesulfovibrio liaohensis]WMW66701.1 endonuclease/exonuclease/phosphatase family protein [Nitratidesulfovibrio liaohensis]
MFHGNVSPQIAAGLLELRKRIDAAKIPSSRVDETLNIATWNIREFGKAARDQAAIHYIAEIIGQFDLVSMVELRDDLSDLKRVLDILGPYWRAIYSDVFPGDGGNNERIAYVYDKRTVAFKGLAATAVPPPKKRGTMYLPDFAWWRPPYLASFASGNFDFIAIAAHIQWGTAGGRELELSQLAAWVDERRTAAHAVDPDILVMGDFNIPDRTGKLYKAVTSKGLCLPKGLAGVEHGSNLEKDKRYDQILHYPAYPENFTNVGGVLDFYIDKAGINALFPGMNKTDFTYQMSDHLPLWLQMRTDIDGMVLTQLIA